MSGSKKKWPRTVSEARTWIDFDHPQLSVREQCRVLGVHRSNVYYDPVPESQENLRLMRLMDEEHLRRPHRGSRQMVDFFTDQGLVVNRKKVQRLMRKMGLEGMSPKRRTTLRMEGHQVYPYLLRNLEVNRPNQVWCCDITYIPLALGFLYLVAVMDWFSRYVLSWRLSNSMDVDFCIEALEEAFAFGKPEVFNTDQGSQFTSREFTGALKSQDIAISMDGNGIVEHPNSNPSTPPSSTPHPQLLVISLEPVRMIVSRCLADNPRDRYESATSLLRQLGSLQ